MPQHYLRRWSPDGKRVLVMRLPVSEGGFVASTRDLAVETNLYAIETPEGLDQTVERDITRPIDDGFSRAIEALLRGEFGAVSVMDLATAVGFQFARGPEVKAQLEHIATEVARAKEKFSSLFQGEGVDEAALASIVEKPAQNEWVTSLLSSIARMAAVFGGMRWHFVYFPEPMLVTSDSPISFWRRESLDRGNIGLGLMSVDEVRLPLAPTLALVMSWESGQTQAVTGDAAMARELNIGTCEFAMRQRVFAYPEPLPPMPQTEAEFERRPVVADLSVLPPMHEHRDAMRDRLLGEVEQIPGLEGVAALLREQPEDEDQG